MRKITIEHVLCTLQQTNHWVITVTFRSRDVAAYSNARGGGAGLLRHRTWH